MLPSLPRTFGRLTDVFASSLGAINGRDNRLGFAKASRVIAILVDGLGAQNLRDASGHAPFLNHALAARKPIACGFPSTTATSLTSFATGLAAGEHGIVGYKILDRKVQREANMLTGWSPEQIPLVWQPNQTLVEKAAASGVQSMFIGPKAYAESGFTQLTMRGAKYLPAKSIDDRIDQAIQVLAETGGEALIYLYIPELDQIAHSSGVQSGKWLEVLEVVDSGVRRLTAALGRSDAALLTADHGIVDVPQHAHIYLDEVGFDWGKVALVGGDPRVNFMYLTDSADSSGLRATLEKRLGESVVVFSREEAVQAGLYGPKVSNVALDRMPELFVMANKKVALYHRDYAPRKSLEMIGQHGALSPQELSIPLLGWGTFSSI